MNWHGKDAEEWGEREQYAKRLEPLRDVCEGFPHKAPFAQDAEHGKVAEEWGREHAAKWLKSLSCYCEGFAHLEPKNRHRVKLTVVRSL